MDLSWVDKFRPGISLQEKHIDRVSMSPGSPVLPETINPHENPQTGSSAAALPAGEA